MFRFIVAMLLLSSWCAQGQEVQVMTFNIRYDHPGDPLVWDDRKFEVAQSMFFHDIIGIQEGLKHQVEFIDNQLPLHEWYGVGRDDGKEGGEYAAVFYNTQKFDFVHGETIWLSPHPQMIGSVGWDAVLPRTASIVILMHRSSGKTLRIINTHFSHLGDEARLFSAWLLRGYASLATEDHVIIMGDFNDTPDTPSYKVLASEPYTDSYFKSGLRCRQDFTTYSTFYPDESYLWRIDHIFTNLDRVNWICAEETIKWGYYISDHLPLFISFDL